MKIPFDPPIEIQFLDSELKFQKFTKRKDNGLLVNIKIVSFETEYQINNFMESTQFCIEIDGFQIKVQKELFLDKFTLSILDNHLLDFRMYRWLEDRKECKNPLDEYVKQRKVATLELKAFTEKLIRNSFISESFNI